MASWASRRVAWPPFSQVDGRCDWALRLWPCVWVYDGGGFSRQRRACRPATGDSPDSGGTDAQGCGLDGSRDGKAPRRTQRPGGPRASHACTHPPTKDLVGHVRATHAPIRWATCEPRMHPPTHPHFCAWSKRVIASLMRASERVDEAKESIGCSIGCEPNDLPSSPPSHLATGLFAGRHDNSGRRGARDQRLSICGDGRSDSGRQTVRGAATGGRGRGGGQDD